MASRGSVGEAELKDTYPRLGIVIDYAGEFSETVDLLVAYERAGMEVVSIPEAYSFDAVSQLGYVAARTEKLHLMSSILPIYSRTPSLTAMTAAGLDYVSHGRFTLGIGASGPQVIEGFHGVAYDAPLQRTREIVEVCRRVWSREPLRHDGLSYSIPLTREHGGTGLGKPLKIINRPLRSDIPVSIAALGPKNVALAAEIAQGWQPGFFHPGKADLVWGKALEIGLATRDPGLGPLEIQLQVNFHCGEVEPHIESAVRDQLALYIGGMGARGKNFYNDLARRYGYGGAAAEIQDLYLSGRKQDAARAVPDDLVSAVTLMGDRDELRRQLAAFRKAGVTTLLLNPLASSAEERVAHVEALTTLLEQQPGPPLD